jgi:hypothetical protein
LKFLPLELSAVAVNFVSLTAQSTRYHVYRWILTLASVFLYRQLHSDRDPIPDVPAVYFCLPTEENLGRIGQDLQSNLYDAYHLNFISPISRQRLEDLAAAALQANCVSQIQKVMNM